MTKPPSMPYGYRKRNMRRGRPMRRNYRKKAVPVPRRKPTTTKGFIRKNSLQINKMHRSIVRLKAAAFGQKQFYRQIVRSVTGLPSQQLARISANFPACFLHQAITENAPIWQVGLAPVTGQFETQQVAAWANQPFPLATTDPLSVKFDQLQFCQVNSLGCQPGYLHLSTAYELLFTAVNWNGWVEVCQVTQRKYYNRQATGGGGPAIEDWQMPSGLTGFANSCLGTGGLQYSPAPWMYTTKILKRMYFNTSTSTTSDLIHTNNQRACRIVVRNNKYRAHIRAQKAVTDPAAIFNPDISSSQSDWILFRASNPARPTADSHLAVNVTRCPVFRDSVGSS